MLLEKNSFNMEEEENVTWVMVFHSHIEFSGNSYVFILKIKKQRPSLVAAKFYFILNTKQ